MRSPLRKQENSLWLLRFGLLGLALAFIGAGLARGEHREVLQKAVRICLECIGIG